MKTDISIGMVSFFEDVTRSHSEVKYNRLIGIVEGMFYADAISYKECEKLCKLADECFAHTLDPNDLRKQFFEITRKASA